MNLTELETFVRAVQEGSLSAAARKLHVSQPAVSTRLRKLEQSVGEPLLLRTGRGVTLTPAGSHLYSRALPMLEELLRLGQEVTGDGPLRGRLQLAATDIVAVHHLPPVLRKLRRRHPRLELAVFVEGTSGLLDLLETGATEIAVGTLPVDPARFEARALFHDPLVVVGPPKHSLARARKVSPEDVAGETWILHKSTSVTRRLVEGFFGALGLSLRVEMEISSPEAIRELVRSGLGLSVLPEAAVRRDIGSGRLARIPVQGFVIDRSSGWIVRRARPLSSAATALRDLLDEDSERH
ncbi:MAG: LysR family transcriptional regulator [Candidatus Eisenbacteria bacterium]|uniref:LysR family transcriptional regulator n=1 Tax=Eiseniibacteriota bacterium TaxID=2212470 RepID=A0A956SCE6_UNCEI|nr:LysR family transcriptional regulator [Candidatus Eisenbacteria bacterium]